METGVAPLKPVAQPQTAFTPPHPRPSASTRPASGPTPCSQYPSHHTGPTHHSAMRCKLATGLLALLLCASLAFAQDKPTKQVLTDAQLKEREWLAAGAVSTWEPRMWPSVAVQSGRGSSSNPGSRNPAPWPLVRHVAPAPT